MEEYSIKIKQNWIYKDTPNRLMKVLTSNRMHEFWSKYFESCNIVKGDFAEIGSHITIKFKSGFQGYSILENIVDTEVWKMISYHIYIQDPLSFDFYLNYHIYWNSCEENCILTIEIRVKDPELAFKIEPMLLLTEKLDVSKEIAKALLDSTEDLEQTETIVINCNIAKVWNILTNWDIFRTYVPAIGDQVEFEGDSKVAGTILKLKTGNSSYKLQVIKYLESEEHNEYYLETYGTSSKNPKQELQFTVVDIGGTSVMVSFKHVFKASTKYESLLKISIEKQKILQTFKKNIENE